MTPPAAVPDDALFHIDGDRVIPHEYTQGPWNPEHQHGGPVAGLLAHLAERHPTVAPMRATRITVDLMRGVPVDELRADVEELRGGARVQLVRVTLHHGATAVAQGTVLKLREAAVPTPVDPDREAHVDDEPLPHPDTTPQFPPGERPESVSFPGFIRAVEMRRVIGGMNTGAPSVTWVRLRCPVVRGVETSPFVRYATIGDFVSGSGQYLPYTDWITINPDFTLYLTRNPVGEWIGMRGLVKNDPAGLGMSEAVFYDQSGRFGRAVSSVLILAR